MNNVKIKTISASAIITGIITALFLYQTIFLTLFFLARFFDIMAIFILIYLNLLSPGHK